MPKTLNKNGTPRKIGSGKTKGAGCYADVTWADLKNVIGENTRIQVSRVWLKNIGVQEIKKLKNKVPSVNAEKLAKESKPLPTPKITRINEKKVFTDSSSENSTDENYDAPPLFGTGEIKLNQY
ncbi:MAG: hypothetical protein P8P49_06765 [Opitutales bacterium]|nr:hypothetical protein [Opitutales bacterium]